MTAKQQAEQFIRDEKEFHLGFLQTEQRHCATMDFSATVQRDTAEGVRQLLSVDRDLAAAFPKAVGNRNYGQLEAAIENVLANDRKIGFSGCGSTGRLSILLESMWRRFWNRAAGEFPERAERYRRRAENSRSMITGGDRALIKSVESFEDYQRFGARQFSELGMGAEDLLVCITEGGETSSVIGSGRQALEDGCRVFYVYNNPTASLIEGIERSRKILQEEGITALDLSTGPMALSGSTRMQATSMELLVVGMALERVCAAAVARENSGAAPDRYPVHDTAWYLGQFTGALDLLSGPVASGALAGVADLEAEIYTGGGLITYYADIYLLDIFSDTTERSPTFMLPPFRRENEKIDSWAFARDPLRDTPEAWRAMLQREPRGLNWTAADYAAMDAPQALKDNPPSLDLDEIMGYRIGKERCGDRSRNGLLLYLDFADDRSAEQRDAFRARAAEAASGFERGVKTMYFGGRSEDDFVVPLSLPATPFYLFYHLMFKIAFNVVSTATMGIMGRIRGNYMVQVDATNKKLIDRATRIIRDLAGTDYLTACTALFESMVSNRASSRESNTSHVLSALAKLDQ